MIDPDDYDPMRPYDIRDVDLQMNQNGWFQPHLVVIHPDGGRESQIIDYPPTADHLNYLTGGWGVSEVLWWKTYRDLPCVAYSNPLAHEPNAPATALWLDQTTKRQKDMALRGAVVLTVAPQAFLSNL